MANLTIVPRGTEREGDIIEDFCPGCGHADDHSPDCLRGRRTLKIVPPGAEVDSLTDPMTLAGAWQLARMSLRPGMLLVGIEVLAWTEAGTTWVAAAATLNDWAVGQVTMSGEGSTEVSALTALADRLLSTGLLN